MKSLVIALKPSLSRFFLILLVFYAIIRLVSFCLTHLIFRPQKRDKKVAPSGH